MPVMEQNDFPFISRCCACGNSGALEDGFTCTLCGDVMTIEAQGRLSGDLPAQRCPSMGAYMALLPVRVPDMFISLGEGGTPYMGAKRLATLSGISELFWKNETVNPTGSFKDRQIAVGISCARERGADTVAVVSSGNVAVAASAYAARAGMGAILFMHGQAGRGKIAQAAAYGAEVVCLDTALPSRAFALCMEACARWGWAHLSTAGMYAPYNVEGAKTIAYEIFTQSGGALPDWVVMPVGGGGLLGGVWRGFLDLKRMGHIDTLPRLVGVQAEGCAPLRKALEQGWSFRESLAHPWENPRTVAGGIADDVLFDGHTALPAIRETGGAALCVSDEEILEAVKTLARYEGILVERTSAVVIAALRKLPDAARRQRVCCILTGNGMKDLSNDDGPGLPIAPIPPTLEAVRRQLDLA